LAVKSVRTFARQFIRIRYFRSRFPDSFTLVTLPDTVNVNELGYPLLESFSAAPPNSLKNCAGFADPNDSRVSRTEGGDYGPAGPPVRRSVGAARPARRHGQPCRRRAVGP